MDITIVVVTFNSAQDLPDFLDSLDALEAPGLRVLVADNASSDDTVSLARSHHRDVEVVETGGNLGYAAAINAAMRQVDDDALVVIANPDIRFRPGFLPAVHAVLADDHVGVVAPMLLDERDQPLPSLRREPAVRRALAEAVLGGTRAARLGLSEVVTRPAVYRREVDAEWVTGALLVVTPACREKLGAWDESFFLYSEETDYLLRARDAGYVVRYIPRAAAFHRGGGVHGNPELWSTLTCNRVRLFRKRHGRMHTAAFYTTVLLNEALRMRGSATHRRAVRELLRRARSLTAWAPTPTSGVSS